MNDIASPEIQKALQEIQKLLETEPERDRLIWHCSQPKVIRLLSDSHPLFSSLAPFLTPEVIAWMGRHPDEEINLLLLGDRVDSTGKFHYYQHIFKHRDLLSKEEIFKLWFQLFNCGILVWRTEYAEVVGQDKIIRIDATSPDLEMLESLPLIDPLLADHPKVGFHISLAKKKGWQFLRFLNEHYHWKEQEMYGKLPEAIREDHAEKFLISLDLTGTPVSFNVLMRIINDKAWKIFKALLKRVVEGEDAEFTLEELCCYCVLKFDENEAVYLLSLIEKTDPGIIKRTQDDLGRNLLWYLIQNRKVVWFNPRSPLVEFLLRHCDQENTNTLGFTWRYVYDSITMKQKRYQLRLRSTFGNKLTYP